MQSVIDELRSAAPLKGHWFHSIDLGGGLWTNGHKTREIMESEMTTWRFPTDLTGKTVLDIGCADGGWSVCALRRGAVQVVAIDEQETVGRRLISRAGIFPNIQFRTIDLFSREFLDLPQFDFVIFAGVLYHVQDPLEALKRVRTKVKGKVLLETHVNESLSETPPYAVFYEHDELGQDPTNWWGPNTSCLEAMLRVAGFEFQRTMLTWQTPEKRNGRVAYLLSPGKDSTFAKVIDGATGSGSMLEEYQYRITQLGVMLADRDRKISELQRLIDSARS